MLLLLLGIAPASAGMGGLGCRLIGYVGGLAEYDARLHTISVV